MALLTRAEIKQILNDPAEHDWIKINFAALLKRDPNDAISDVETVLQMLRSYYKLHFNMDF